jgi:hypothetical protein
MSALTGIPTLDQCVKDYRSATKIIASLEAGVVKGRATLEALLQVRSLLAGNERNANTIARLDAAIGQSGMNAESINDQMKWAQVRHQAFRAYVEAGEHCYEVSPALAEALSVTELRGVTGDSLRLPFSNVALVAPAEWRDMAQVVFVAITPTDCSHCIDTGEQSAHPVLSIVTYGRNGTRTETYSIKVVLDTGDIREALATATRRSRDDGGQVSHLDGTKARLKRLFWWIVNVCLYVTHAGAEAEPRHPNAEAERAWQVLNSEPGPKRRQRLLDLYNARFRRRIYVGRNVQSLNLNPGARGPLVVRTLVAGHWRNQVCGAGRQERRLTWIEPFWRGPESGPISNPIRVAREGRAEPSTLSRLVAGS